MRGPLTIRLFGPLEVHVGDHPLPRLRSQKGSWLLALLALRPGAPVDRSWLAGILWPDSSAASGAHSLRVSLADLRRALGTEAGRLRSTTAHRLCLDLMGAAVDVLDFDQAIGRGDVTSLQEAMRLYRGPLLEGCLEAWAFEERQAREEAYLAALETLAAAALEQGEVTAAERHLRRAMAVDPLRESAQRALMQVLAAGGNYAAAMQTYRELRLLLHREINAEPDAETQAMFQQLRTEAREKGGGRGQGAGANRRAASRQSNSATLAGCLAPSLTSDPWLLPLSLARGRMVGRDAELSELKRQVDAALAGGGSTLFLAGEPGIGKTRLATEGSAYAQLQGFRVLAGRCDEQGAAPYQPLVEALREYLDTAESGRIEQAMPPPVACELVRIVPQIASQVKEIPGYPRSGWMPPLPADQARQALADAVRQFFAFVTTHDAPVLLFLDDLHWADEGSLALLHALARQARNLRLLILGTYRDTELGTQHPLERTLSGLNRERLSRQVSLRRLSEPAAAQMVAALLDEPLHGTGPTPSPTGKLPSPFDPNPNPNLNLNRSGLGLAPFLATLHRETEGNPFFIEELLEHLVEEGAIYREGGHWQIQLPEQFTVPQSIKVTIGRRLQRVSEASREALTLAAVIGQQFSFDLLLQASELTEERLLAITEEWLRAHLVVEQRLGREEVYRFQHALIRAVPYEALSLRRKARLHERVGLALEAVYAGALEEHLEELAHHFAQARGGTAVEKGIDYCLRAGEKARNLYANEEAIQHLTAALELLEELPEDEPHLRKRWEVVFNLQKAYRDCRAFEVAEDVLQEYLALAQRVGYPWGMAAAHREMAWVLLEAQAAAGVIGSEISRRLREEHLEKSLQIAEEHGLTDCRARARVGLADPAFAGGKDPPRAEALLRETLQDPEGLLKEEVRRTYGELMRVCALQEKWDEIAAAVRQSIPFGGPDYRLFICLGPMEEALNRAGRQAEFVAFCEETKALYAQAGLPFTLKQWYLEPTTPCEQFCHLLFRDEFDAPELRPEWEWHDPVQASAYCLSERPDHLTLRAGREVDLHPGSNLNAPRMLLEVRGDFALETKMAGDWDERNLGHSGLLVWKDALNYVRLDKFALHRLNRGAVRLEARAAGQYEIFGRGQLRGNTYHLRLERTGDRFAALCSTDGVHWLTCGHVVLPVKDPLMVGVWAAYEMVVHFDYVQVLGRGQERSDPPAKRAPGGRNQ